MAESEFIMTRDRIFTAMANGSYHAKSAGKNNTEQYRLYGTMSGQKTIFGHRIESQAAIIDSMLLQGRFTIVDMARSAKYSTDKKAIARVRQHLNAKLRDKLNIDIVTDDHGVIYAANVTQSAENYALVVTNRKAKAEQAKAEQAKHVRRQAAIKGMIKKQKKA
jgi:hypothetical protein